MILSKCSAISSPASSDTRLILRLFWMYVVHSGIRHQIMKGLITVTLPIMLCTLSDTGYFLTTLPEA